MRAAILDPADEHARRSRADHPTGDTPVLEAKGDSAEHVGKTAAVVSALFAGAGFVFPRGVDAAKAAPRLNALRRDRPPADLPPGVDAFTPKAVAALLGGTTSAVGKSLRRRGLVDPGRVVGHRPPAGVA